MRSICFFSSYFTGDKVPEYVKYYLTELVRHFSEVVYMTTEKVITDSDTIFLKEKNIRLMLVKNEGYDFGMWQKGLNSIDVTLYDRIGFVNDSCILFNKLDKFFTWINNNEYDFCGFTESNKPQYHVQSYFLVANKNAIPLFKEYLDQNGPKPTIKEVIDIYEIGISNYMQKTGMRIAAFYKDNGKYDDPTWIGAKHLINNGYPFVKKRIINRNYGQTDYRYLVARGFDAHPSHYINLIKKITGNGDQIDKIFGGMKNKLSLMKETEFQFMCFAARIYGVLIKGTRTKEKRGAW